MAEQTENWKWGLGTRSNPNGSFYDELSEQESSEFRAKQIVEERQLRTELNFDVDDIYPIDYATFRL